MRKATGKIGHERSRRPSVARSHEPCWNQLGLCINHRPRPYVAKSKLSPQRFRQVLFLRVAERPDFIALEPPTRQIAERLILVRPTCRAHIGQELEDGR